MATVYLIVLAAVITTVTAGAAVLPACKDCEICVGVIPLRPGGCQLPLSLSAATATYDVCPAVPAPPPPKICPCIADLTTVNSVDLATGMKVTPTISAAGVVASGSTHPVAVFSSRCKIQAVISADGSTVACDPVAVGTDSTGKVEGLCAGVMVDLPDYIDESGYLKNFDAPSFTASGCSSLQFPTFG